MSVQPPSMSTELLSSRPTLDYSWVSLTGLEGYCSRRLLPNERPSHAEILGPPFLFIILLAAGLGSLIIFRTWRSKRNRIIASLCQPHTNRYLGSANSKLTTDKPGVKIDILLEQPQFFNDFDLEVLNRVKTFHNKPKELTKICIPAFSSLLLTTAAMFTYEPMTDCLWPSVGRPSINTAVTCFLAPAGLVYALSFGFVFQQTLERQRAILNKVTKELSLMDQMATLATKLRLPTPKHSMVMLKAIKSEVVFMAMLVQNREPSTFKSKAPENIKVHIWSIIDVLRDAASHPEYNFKLNVILVDKVVSYVVQLNSICIDRMGALHTRIHPLKWVFLDVLGSLTLFGVMLIDAESRGMEVAMCELTIFSVTMLCFVLADLDSPFNGFFRVDVGVIPDVVTRLEGLYHCAEMENRRLEKKSAGADGLKQ